MKKINRRAGLGAGSFLDMIALAVLAGSQAGFAFKDPSGGTGAAKAQLGTDLGNRVVGPQQFGFKFVDLAKGKIDRLTEGDEALAAQDGKVLLVKFRFFQGGTAHPSNNQGSLRGRTDDDGKAFLGVGEVEVDPRRQGMFDQAGQADTGQVGHRRGLKALRQMPPLVGDKEVTAF